MLLKPSSHPRKAPSPLLRSPARSNNAITLRTALATLGGYATASSRRNRDVDAPWLHYEMDEKSRWAFSPISPLRHSASTSPLLLQKAVSVRLLDRRDCLTAGALMSTTHHRRGKLIDTDSHPCLSTKSGVRPSFRPTGLFYGWRIDVYDTPQAHRELTTPETIVF